MNFDLSAEQKMLFEHSLELLSSRSTGARLRELIDAGQEWDEPLWREVARSGFLGVALPELYGGMGLGWLEMGLVSEALGRVSSALPVFSSAVLAAQAINLAGSDEQRSRWLPQIISGECVATLAYAEGTTNWRASAAQTVWSSGRLCGVKEPVSDGGIASLAVVLVSQAHEAALALVELDQSRVRRVKLDSFDQLRAHYRLEFDDVHAELLPNSRLPGLIDHLFDRAAVQCAFEAVGGADACLAMARDYTLERQVFGRLLGSYQAIKHKLADVLVGIELARSNAYFAAWTVDSNDGRLALAAAAARLTGLEAYERAARDNMQVHGGIAYTLAVPCHLHYRRERTLALNLEGRDAWSQRLLASLSNTTPPTSQETSDGFRR